MKKTEWEKLMMKVKRKEYNKWFEKQKRISEEDIYWMLTGVRFYFQGQREKYPGEYLEPESKESIKYYNNLNNL